MRSLTTASDSSQFDAVAANLLLQGAEFPLEILPTRAVGSKFGAWFDVQKRAGRVRGEPMKSESPKGGSLFIFFFVGSSQRHRNSQTVAQSAVDGDSHSVMVDNASCFCYNN